MTMAAQKAFSNDILICVSGGQLDQVRWRRGHVNEECAILKRSLNLRVLPMRKVSYLLPSTVSGNFAKWKHLEATATQNGVTKYRLLVCKSHQCCPD